MKDINMTYFRIMIFKRFTILSFLFQATILQTTIDNYAESKKRSNIDENLLEKRCELMNYEYKLDNVSLAQCVKNLKKPGNCPSPIYNNFTGKILCLETCHGYDYKCSGIKKCCYENNCGPVCQKPDNLLYDNTLPPIPENLVIKNLKRKGRSCELSWEIPIINSQNHFLYIIESRWHYGIQFSPRKLREWKWLDYEITGHILTFKTSMKRTQARIKLKRGRYYQFRIAMINENGFKGYSEPSLPFRLYDVATHITDPRPPKPPRNFKITSPKILPNNSIYAKITWLPNRSDIPIEKYYISWALYIKAENNSLLLNYAFVKEPIHYYEFWNLHPQSMYYIQIQAIAVHGKRRPKSQKCSIFYNTTLSSSYSLEHLHSEFFSNYNYNHSNFYIELPSFSSTLNIGTGYNMIARSKNFLYAGNNSHYQLKQPIKTIKFLLSKKYGLLARVVFTKDTNEEKYLLELCPGNFSTCESKEYEATKMKDEIDFNQLKFSEQYTLRVIDTKNHIINKEDGIIIKKSFLTPTCEEWFKKNPKLKTIYQC